VLAAWAARYIGAAATAEPQVADPPAGTVLVQERGAAAGKLAQQIAAGRHRLAADEPVEAGGGDSGPNPYDLLLGALGACTSMTLRLYADRKGWPVERIAVQLRHEKIHAADCAECETREGRIDRIERRIALTGPLDAGQRERLLEIAGKCPVHRTLEGEKQILTRLVD
jgi:putative redox protein